MNAHKVAIKLLKFKSKVFKEKTKGIVSNKHKTGRGKYNLLHEISTLTVITGRK